MTQAKVIDISKAVAPALLGAAQNHCAEHDETWLYLEVKGLPSDYDKQPADEADMISTVLMFDAETVLQFLNFVFHAGFVAFGPAPFVTDIEETGEQLIERGKNSTIVEAILRDVQAKAGKANGAKTDPPQGMYL